MKYSVKSLALEYMIYDNKSCHKISVTYRIRKEHRVVNITHGSGLINLPKSTSKDGGGSVPGFLILIDFRLSKIDMKILFCLLKQVCTYHDVS